MTDKKLDPEQLDPGHPGELAIRVLAMPSNTNPNGEIFGGWIVSQMDLAGLSVCAKHTKNKVVTIGIQAMKFIAPVHVGDFICCYVNLERLGRTSITVKITTFAVNARGENRHKVTEGLFTYVSLDTNGKSTAL